MNPRLFAYLVSGLANAGVVYAVYTPYVFLWLGFSWWQYVRWLEGGVVFSLAVGWLFARVSVVAWEWALARARAFGSGPAPKVG